MNHISRWAIVCSLLAMNLSGLSFAGEHLDKGTLEALIKGNTVEGKNIKWETTYKMYFDPSERLSRIDSNDLKENGEWHVERNDTLCINVRKERCRTVKQRDDGGYDVYNRIGRVIWTMDKVTPGNPYNLE